MSTSSEIENNPFFKNGINNVCGICNRKLDNTLKCSVQDQIPKLDEPVLVYEVLKLFSDFTQYNIVEGPQNLCKTCFENTIAAYRFHVLCNKSVKKILAYLNYQENIKLEYKDNNNDADKSIKLELAVFEENGIETENTGEILDGIVKTELHEDSKDKKKKILCKICDKSYADTYFHVHQRIHSGVKPYKCRFCEKSFRQRTDIKRHEAAHGDERRHLCDVCGKGFKNQNHLAQHERIHTGEKPFICKFCGKAYRNSSMRKEHYATHSGEKLFTCEFCAKSFSARKHLKQHLITHAEVKRHECHLCGNRFTQAHSLRTHLSKHCKGGI